MYSRPIFNIVKREKVGEVPWNCALRRRTEIQHAISCFDNFIFIFYAV